MSGLAAAFGLTSAPNWQGQYDIEVLQLGWRLGGKGASGRNPDAQQRIEEHGLHIWGGFYENAFRVMRACYAAMNRPPTAPLATWDQAFKPSPMVSWMEDLGTWKPWNNSFPEYADSTPGDGAPMPSLAEGVLRIVEWIIQTAVEPPDAARRVPSWIEMALKHAREELPAAPESVRRAQGAARPDSALHHAVDVHTLLRAIARNPAVRELHQAAVWLLSAYRDVVLPAMRARAGASDGARRAAICRFMLRRSDWDPGGQPSRDRFQCRRQRGLHGLVEPSRGSPDAVNSAVTRGVYDFIFAYRQGDPTQPALGAGVGLRCVLRLVMWYKGAIFWKMQAGMGDVVFTPLYQVLQERGVRFKFFQQVQNLGLSSDQGSIATITVGEQATLTGPDYQPLVEVNGLACCRTLAICTAGTGSAA